MAEAELLSEFFFFFWITKITNQEGQNDHITPTVHECTCRVARVPEEHIPCAIMCHPVSIDTNVQGTQGVKFLITQVAAEIMNWHDYCSASA